MMIQHFVNIFYIHISIRTMCWIDITGARLVRHGAQCCCDLLPIRNRQISSLARLATPEELAAILELISLCSELVKRKGNTWICNLKIGSL